MTFRRMPLRTISFAFRAYPVTPPGSFQQAIRCRNIRKLFYFGECFEQEACFNTLDDVNTAVAEGIRTTKSFHNSCTYLGEFDQLQVVRNTFFSLYCYPEWVRDAYETNKVMHFEAILKNDGCGLSSEGTPQQLNQNEKTHQSELAEDMLSKLFDEVVASEREQDQKLKTFSKKFST